MNIRSIYLLCKHPESGFSKDFSVKFRYNTWGLCYYLSRHVRKLRIPADRNYNLLSCTITRKEDSLDLNEVVNFLGVNVHVSDEDIQSYLSMRSERDRFEFYFSLLERGYRYAAKYHDIPVDEFLKLHQKFRDEGYKNEWLFKKKMFRNYGIKVILEHTLTQYEYNLRLTVTDLKGNYINSGNIYTTLPSYFVYGGNVRHLVVTDKALQITDVIDKPQFECQLEDLARGVIKAKCFDDRTIQQMPNEQNKEEYESLRWD